MTGLRSTTKHEKRLYANPFLIPATALAVLVAAAVASALAVSTGQAPPLAVRRDLASTEEFSPDPSPALLAQPGGQGAIPVLASPQAVAYLGESGAAPSPPRMTPTLQVRVSGGTAVHPGAAGRRSVRRMAQPGATGPT